MQQQIEAVQRMQDYIALHLREEITPDQLARAAHFSPWYARRLFIQHTGFHLRMMPAGSVCDMRLSACGMTPSPSPKLPWRWALAV